MTEEDGRVLRWAGGVWVLWTLATWWFEGRIETLGRPDAVIDRLIYTTVANIVIGVLGTAMVLRRLAAGDFAVRSCTGFGSWRRTAFWGSAGVALGLVLYYGQGAPSTDPAVMMNAYAQVFVVSVAEVMICWSLVGGMIRFRAGVTSRVAAVAAAGVASILFGIYHFAHSAPFNTIPMVAFLTVIGLITSVFFFLSRDIYATILFHNFLGMFGVVQALVAGGDLVAFERVQIPLVVTAVVALGILVLADVLIIRRPVRRLSRAPGA